MALDVRERNRRRTMTQTLRLDKYLADMSVGTRSEVKNYIRKGRVSINGEIEKRPERKINIQDDMVAFDQKIISYMEYEYYMLYKPAGVVSATEDKYCTTVIDLLPKEARKDLFPVGRLDKDTEGLLLITNDGMLAHKLLSPKKKVAKVYYVVVEGVVTQEDIEKMRQGIQIKEEQGNDWTTLPAELTILESGIESKVELTIYEGKFHQVKRMFEALDKKVIYLKRLSMGNLVLDQTLEKGQYRKLKKEELESL